MFLSERKIRKPIFDIKGYYRAAHSLARTARQMSRQLWRPATECDGVSFDTLCTFARSLTEWRDEYLNQVGVPSNFEGEWDFVSVSFVSSIVDIRLTNPCTVGCLFVFK